MLVFQKWLNYDGFCSKKRAKKVVGLRSKPQWNTVLGWEGVGNEIWETLCSGICCKLTVRGMIFFCKIIQDLFLNPILPRKSWLDSHHILVLDEWRKRHHVVWLGLVPWKDTKPPFVEFPWVPIPRRNISSIIPTANTNVPRSPPSSWCKFLKQHHWPKR